MPAIFFNILVILGIMLIAYVIIKIIEHIILKHFFKTKEIMSATTAYDLCLLYKKKIISEKRLINELSRYSFTPADQEIKKLEEDWRKILPPDPFGSFDEQIGRALKNRLISRALYDYLVDSRITKEEQDNK